MVSAGPNRLGRIRTTGERRLPSGRLGRDKRRMVAPIDHSACSARGWLPGEGERGQPLPALLQFEADENPGANPEHHQQESVEEKEKIEIGFESGSQCFGDKEKRAHPEQAECERCNTCQYRHKRPATGRFPRKPNSTGPELYKSRGLADQEGKRTKNHLQSQ